MGNMTVSYVVVTECERSGGISAGVLKLALRG